MDHIYLLRYKYIEIVVHFIGNAPVANILFRFVYNYSADS